MSLSLNTKISSSTTYLCPSHENTSFSDFDLITFDFFEYLQNRNRNREIEFSLFVNDEDILNHICPDLTSTENSTFRAYIIYINDITLITKYLDDYYNYNYIECTYKGQPT